jgi:hypothetical protein
MPGSGTVSGVSALCRERELYVIPAGPDHWEGVPDWRRGADAFADEAVLAADEKWWSAFAERFKDEPGILAYDLLNEPRYSGARQPCVRSGTLG